MRLLPGPRWRSGGPASWPWRVTRAATISSTCRGRSAAAVSYRWSGKLAGCFLSPWTTETAFIKLFSSKIQVQIFCDIMVNRACQLLMRHLLQPFWLSGTLFPLWFLPIMIAELFYAASCDVEANWQRRTLIHETNQEAAVVCVLYYCFMWVVSMQLQYFVMSLMSVLHLCSSV